MSEDLSPKDLALKLEVTKAELDEAVRAEREAWRQTDRVRKERDRAVQFADMHKRLRDDTLEANKKLCAKLDEARALLQETQQLFPRRWGPKTEELGNRIEKYLKENR